MGAEAVKLFGKIELDLSAAATGTLSLQTDIPGAALAERFSYTVPVTGRRPVSVRLPSNMRGHLLKATYTPAGVSTLFGARVWARELPYGNWQWYALPVIDTPVEFHPISLPVPATSEEWRSASLPIPPTSEDWRDAALPIPATTEAWASMRLPIKETPPVPEWVDIEGGQ